MVLNQWLLESATKTMNEHKANIIKHFRKMQQPEIAVGEYVCLRTWQSRVGKVVKIIDDFHIDVQYEGEHGPILREKRDWIIKAAKPDTIP